jgi:hypothetical protein
MVASNPPTLPQANPFETLAQTQTEDTVARLKAFVESEPAAQTLILPVRAGLCVDLDGDSAHLPIALRRLRTDCDSVWAFSDLERVQSLGHFCTVLGV